MSKLAASPLLALFDLVDQKPSFVKAYVGTTGGFGNAVNVDGSLKKSLGFVDGIKIIAYGPQGGKIVGYAKGKPVYAGSKAAQKLAEHKAEHHDLTSGKGLDVALSWLKELGFAPESIKSVGHDGIALKKDEGALLQESFPDLAMHQMSSGTWLVQLGKLLPHMGHPLQPHPKKASGWHAAAAAGVFGDDGPFNPETLAGLKSLGPNTLGGSHGGEIVEDKNGKKYAWKKNHGEVWVSAAEEAFNRIAKLVFPDPKLYPDAELIDVDIGKKGAGKDNIGVLLSWQESTGKLGAESSSHSVANKTMQKHLLRLVQHQVLDWMMSNHDSHGGNFLITPKGDVAAIDKGQAFKAIGSDVLSPSWKLTGNGSSPVYNQLWQQLASGDLKAKTEDIIKAVDDVLSGIAKISEEQYKLIVTPYLQAGEAGISGFKADKKWEAIKARFHSMQGDWEGFLSKQLGQPVKLQQKAPMPTLEVVAQTPAASKPKKVKVTISETPAETPSVPAPSAVDPVGLSATKTGDANTAPWVVSVDGEETDEDSSPENLANILAQGDAIPWVTPPAQESLPLPAVPETKIQQLPTLLLADKLKDMTTFLGLPKGTVLTGFFGAHAKEWTKLDGGWLATGETELVSSYALFTSIADDSLEEAGAQLPAASIPETKIQQLPGWPKKKSTVTVHHPGNPPTVAWPAKYPGPGYKADVEYKGKTFGYAFHEKNGAIAVEVTFPDGSTHWAKSPNEAADFPTLLEKGLPLTLTATEKKAQSIGYAATKFLKLAAFAEDFAHAVSTPQALDVETKHPASETVKELEADKTVVPEKKTLTAQEMVALIEDGVVTDSASLPFDVQSDADYFKGEGKWPSAAEDNGAALHVPPGTVVKFGGALYIKRSGDGWLSFNPAVTSPLGQKTLKIEATTSPGLYQTLNALWSVKVLAALYMPPAPSPPEHPMLTLTQTQNAAPGTGFVVDEGPGASGQKLWVKQPNGTFIDPSGSMATAAAMAGSLLVGTQAPPKTIAAFGNDWPSALELGSFKSGAKVAVGNVMYVKEYTGLWAGSVGSPSLTSPELAKLEGKVKHAPGMAGWGGYLLPTPAQAAMLPVGTVLMGVKDNAETTKLPDGSWSGADPLDASIGQSSFIVKLPTVHEPEAQPLEAAPVPNTPAPLEPQPLAAVLAAVPPGEAPSPAVAAKVTTAAVSLDTFVSSKATKAKHKLAYAQFGSPVNKQPGHYYLSCKVKPGGNAVEALKAIVAEAGIPPSMMVGGVKKSLAQYDPNGVGAFAILKEAAHQHVVKQAAVTVAEAMEEPPKLAPAPAHVPAPASPAPSILWPTDAHQVVLSSPLEAEVKAAAFQDAPIGAKVTLNYAETPDEPGTSVTYTKTADVLGWPWKPDDDSDPHSNSSLAIAVYQGDLEVSFPEKLTTAGAVAAPAIVSEYGAAALTPSSPAPLPKFAATTQELEALPPGAVITGQNAGKPGGPAYLKSAGGSWKKLGSVANGAIVTTYSGSEHASEDLNIGSNWPDNEKYLVTGEAELIPGTQGQPPPLPPPMTPTQAAAVVVASQTTQIPKSWTKAKIAAAVAGLPEGTKMLFGNGGMVVLGPSGMVHAGAPPLLWNHYADETMFFAGEKSGAMMPSGIAAHVKAKGGATLIVPGTTADAALKAVAPVPSKLSTKSAFVVPNAEVSLGVLGNAPAGAQIHATSGKMWTKQADGAWWFPGSAVGNDPDSFIGVTGGLPQHLHLMIPLTPAMKEQKAKAAKAEKEKQEAAAKVTAEKQAANAKIAAELKAKVDAFKEWKKEHKDPTAGTTALLQRVQAKLPAEATQKGLHVVENDANVYVGAGSPEAFDALKKSVDNWTGFPPYFEVTGPLGTMLAFSKVKLQAALPEPPQIEGPDGKSYPQGTSFEMTEVVVQTKHGAIATSGKINKILPHATDPTLTAIKVKDPGQVAAFPEMMKTMGLSLAEGVGSNPLTGANTVFLVKTAELEKPHEVKKTLVATTPPALPPLKKASLPFSAGVPSQGSVGTRNQADLQALSTIVPTVHGYCIRIGQPGVLRDHQLRIKRVKRADGSTYYEVHGQLSDFSSTKAATLGMASGTVNLHVTDFAGDGWKNFQFDKETGTHGEGTDDKGWTGRVGKTAGGSEVGVLPLDASSPVLSMANRFVLRIPTDADVQAELHAAFKMMGQDADKALGDHDDNAERIFIKGEIVRSGLGVKGWHTADADGGAIKGTHYADEAWLDAQLASLKMTHLVEKASIVTGIGGYQHVSVDDTKEQNYSEVNFITSGTNNLAGLAPMLAGGGGMPARVLGYMGGSTVIGDSCTGYAGSNDEFTGGSSGTPTRIHSKYMPETQYGNCGGHTAFRIVIHPRVLKRTDWWLNDGDTFMNTGKHHGNGGPGYEWDGNNRDKAFAKGALTSSKGNECCFAAGVPLRDFAAIAVMTPKNKNDLIAAILERNPTLKEINGIPLDKFIVVVPDMKASNIVKAAPGLQPGGMQ